MGTARRGRVAKNAAAWTELGRDNPFWGVLSGEPYDGADAASVPAEFWHSGEREIAGVRAVLAELDPDFVATTVVDFGCGVGRLLVPLAAPAERAYGIDVSAPMLDATRKRLAQERLDNTTLVHTITELAEAGVQADLVHSQIVFQHMPVEAGEQAVRELLGLLRPGGWGALQFYLGRNSGPVVNWVSQARSRSRAMNALVSVVRGKPTLSAQPYEMNGYETRRLLAIFAEFDIATARIDSAVSDDGVSATFYVRRP